MKVAVFALSILLAGIGAILPLADSVATATVQLIDKKSGPTELVPDIAVNRGIDSAARNANAPFGYEVGFVYPASGGTLITVVFQQSVSATELVGDIDKKTVLVRMTVPVGELPEGTLSWTARIVNTETDNVVGVASSGVLDCSMDPCV